MGWGHGEVGGREVGYLVRAKCDKRGCRTRIDRGLSYACGGMHGANEHGCGGYFCPRHMVFSEKPGVYVSICQSCYKLEEAELSKPRVLNRSKILGEIPLGAVYVGRPTEWGNPFNVGKDGDRFEIIDRYRRWIYASDAMVRKAKKELRGLDLVCWCAPQPCHADVLLEMVNKK